MSEQPSSQSQQTPASEAAHASPFTFTPFAVPGFDPSKFQVPGFAEATEAWHKLSAEHLERMQGAMSEYASLESKALEQARQAVDEMAKLAHASITWAHDTSAVFRKMALEAAQRTRN